MVFSETFKDRRGTGLRGWSERAGRRGERIAAPVVSLDDCEGAGLERGFFA